MAPRVRGRPREGLIFAGQSPRRWAVLGALVLLALAGGVAWRGYQLDALMRTLGVDASDAGAPLTVTSQRVGLLEVTAERARLELGPGIVVEASGVRVVRPLLSRPFAVVDHATLTVRGPPADAWERWAAVSSRSNRPVAIRHLTLKYDDSAAPAVTLAGVVREHVGEDERLRSADLRVGQKTWSGASLKLGKRAGGLQLELGEAAVPEQQVALKHVPSDGAAEWLLNIPYQPLAPLLPALGVGRSVADGRAKATGVLSIVVPDDAQRKIFGNLRLVVDDWAQPPWPEASALVGKSGSFAARLQYTGDGHTWTLPRVDVSAALFTLSGTGTLTWGEQLALTADLKGSRTCSELGAHLAPSSYRERVHAYLAERVPSVAPFDSSRASSRSQARAELRLRVTMRSGHDGQLQLDWHLTPACGLDELTGQSVLSR